MTTKHEVIAVHTAHPDWNSVQIASKLNCCDAYVRSTFRRNGMTLIRSRGPKDHNSIYALGRAAKAAGLTVDDINEIGRTLREEVE